MLHFSQYHCGRTFSTSSRQTSTITFHIQTSSKDTLFPVSLSYHLRLVTCKIKHLHKCFRAVDFPRLCRGGKNVVKMFYFTCNHGRTLATQCALIMSTQSAALYIYIYSQSLSILLLKRDTYICIGCMIAGVQRPAPFYNRHFSETNTE